MADTFSTRLGYRLMEDGSHDTTWGTEANLVFTLIEDARAGYLAKSVAGDTSITLTATDGTSDERRNSFIEFTGAMTGVTVVSVPSEEMWWFFKHSATGAFSLTVDATGGTGITLLAGEVAALYCDGTDVFRAVSSNLEADSSPSMGGVLDTNAFSINESEAGAVASTTTTNIWTTDGNTVHVTGGTTITSFGTAPRVGAWRKVIFDAVLTLTDGANLNLPGAANITTAANDFAFVYAETTTLFRVLYFRDDGTSPATETGTWTPTLGFATPGDESIAFDVQFGSWTKSGDLVYALFHVDTSTFTHTTASGSVEIGGLPFAAANVTNQQPRSILQWEGITKAGYTQINALLNPNTSLLNLQAAGSGQARSSVSAADMPTAGNVVLVGEIIYKI